MNKVLSKIATVFVVSMAPISMSFAGLVGPTPVPEPGILPLFAVAAVAFYIAKKRKK